jgi:hypothetical protein
MQLLHFKTTRRAAIFVALVSVGAFGVPIMALTNSVERVLPTAVAEAASPQGKSKVQHFARVKADGTLVNGTAVSAERSSEGRYLVQFAEPISECAAAVNSAAFPGFDSSVFRIMAQISIGFSPVGSPDELSVVVSLFEIDASSTDSSFSLLLTCP